MTRARVMAALERAIDMGVRCALRPFRHAHRIGGASRDARTSCARAPRPPGAARGVWAVLGATPQSEGLVRVRGQVCLRTPAPAPFGSLPNQQSVPEGCFHRRFEAAERLLGDRLAIGLFGIAAQAGGGSDGAGRSHATKLGIRLSRLALAAFLPRTDERGATCRGG